MSVRHHQSIFICCVLLLFSRCEIEHEKMFAAQNPSTTNIKFTNTLTEDEKFNILSYEYIYNGGGVAAGDFNNDGLQDLYFTGNQVSNALYLNEGNWKFKDVTAESGTAGRKAWKTGVTTVDLNNDGWLDIYVCYSGPGADEERANQLFINGGGKVPVFTDKAKEYGLDATGTFSTQAAFFDYDRDGDVDMFLLNHAKITYSPFYNTKKLRALRHPKYGNRLYNNDNGKFSDVSELAGIHGSALNFGLGLSISDLNGDAWPDIYVTNDYEEQDYFYLNNHDGTFRENLKHSFQHIARFGMGCDIADYNNDGLLDVFVADMLPEDNYRQKLLKGPDEFDRYNLLRDSGYHHQNMRNMLQLNQGNHGSGPVFSEVGQLAGVSNTDWSWCPLFVDLDNDGWKDLFITNGYLRDFTNMDFLKYTFEQKKAASANGAKPDTLEIVKSIPSSKVPNYCFHNDKDLTFSNVSESWGLSGKDISSGAVFVDLDNDGDQDLVVNRLNEPAAVYRNNHSLNHFVKIKLTGSKLNAAAIGARVEVRIHGLHQIQEFYPTRGYQSSVAHELLFGTGQAKNIEEVVVHWPDERISRVLNLHADTTLTIDYNQSVANTEHASHMEALFEEVKDSPFDFVHRENEFVDYKSEYLVPYMLSSNGPCLAKADVNGDGFDDLYIGAAAGMQGKLFLSNAKSKSSYDVWLNESGYEDTDAAFFDAEGDGDLDLYVVSGGNEFSAEEKASLQDRLYLNDGHGRFLKTDQLPREKSNGSCVALGDYDNDGDLDLFVGGKMLPGYYPLPAYSYLLRNDSRHGVVKFTDVTPEDLRKPGMITSAVWTDYNRDGWTDLIIAGEFMPVMLIENRKAKLHIDTAGIVANCDGWWSKIFSGDVDGDGDEDLVAGNAGTNLQFKASPSEPVRLYYQDFNEDGKLDPILSYYMGGSLCIYASRDELFDQLPHLKKRFTSYDAYAKAKISDILTPAQLKRAKQLRVQNFRTTLFRNNGTGKFTSEVLPHEAQFSKVNGIDVFDFNQDGIQDILLSGNFFPYRVQLGRSDASFGVLLKGNTDKSFAAMRTFETGLYAGGDVRAMVRIHSAAGNFMVFGRNNDALKIFKINNHDQ